MCLVVAFCIGVLLFVVRLCWFDVLLVWLCVVCLGCLLVLFVVGFVGCVVLRFKWCFNVVVVLVVGFEFCCVFIIPLLTSILCLLFAGFCLLFLVVVFRKCLYSTVGVLFFLCFGLFVCFCVWLLLFWVLVVRASFSMLLYSWFVLSW